MEKEWCEWVRVLLKNEGVWVGVSVIGGGGGWVFS